MILPPSTRAWPLIYLTVNPQLSRDNEAQGSYGGHGCELISIRLREYVR